MVENISVSVYVLAYNHRSYIRQALDGILMQKTDFDFEVIVHDDASNDGTAEIIREYAEKYPEKIKPILQRENQYSQRIDAFAVHILPRVKGKYVAVCEGDDYWNDPLKLQKQVDYMEKHPKCTFCFTNGWLEDQTGKQPRRKFIPFNERDAMYYTEESRIVTLDNLYQMSFVPTASFMMRRDSFDKMPETYNARCMYGDLKMRLFHTALGYGYYMSDVTCTYRQNVQNSVMTQWRRNDRKTAHLRCELACAMISNVDEFTEHKYAEGLWKILKVHIESMLLETPNIKVLLKDLKNDKCRRVFKELPFNRRLKIIIKSTLTEKTVLVLRNAKERCKRYNREAKIR